MKSEYQDIKRALGEPLWYDNHGVPRYDVFTVDMCGVYDDVISYNRIKCQYCGKEFHVTVQHVLIFDKNLTWPNRTDQSHFGQIGSFHYGDAPAHDACTGENMNSVPLQIEQMWTRDGGESKREWRRRPEFEFTLTEDSDA